MLERSALDAAVIPCVTELETGRYPLPNQKTEVEIFKGAKFNELELAEQLRQSSSFERLFAKSSLDSAAKRPPLPLSIGQIGLIGGSGMINGLIECDYPHVIKGRISSSLPAPHSSSSLGEVEKTLKHSAEELKALLGAPFRASEIEWRLQWNNETTGLAVPYLTNRAIQERLDEVVGPMDWKNDFKPWHHFIYKDKGKDKEVISQLCGISIYRDDRQEWVCKWDGAEISDIEPVKGGLSDSMKRAAVEWGMGRILYQMDAVFVDVEKKGQKTIIPAREFRRLDQVYEESIAKIQANTPIPLVNRMALEKGAVEGVAPVGRPVQSVSAPQPTAQPVTAAPKAPSQAPNGQQNIQEEAYEVTNVVIQQKALAGGSNMHLFLKAPDGKAIDAFAQGVDPLILKGTLLTGVKLIQKQSGAIVYYTMDHYDVLAAEGRAAA